MDPEHVPLFIKRNSKPEKRNLVIKFGKLFNVKIPAKVEEEPIESIVYSPMESFEYTESPITIPPLFKISPELLKLTKNGLLKATKTESYALSVKSIYGPCIQIEINDSPANLLITLKMEKTASLRDVMKCLIRSQTSVNLLFNDTFKYMNSGFTSPGFTSISATRPLKSSMNVF